ncbi:MAG: response regulator, partial [Candidatus Cloacimonetes bacterium]|nr:response regulator [Candidatus Cloacimonadota bacterium]
MNYKNQDLIFIVDDEEDILELIKINLEKAGYKTKTFEQTSKLIDEALKYRPSLFVLDLMLPDDDGFEICKRIRNNDSLRDTPIIMLTARSDVMNRI